MWVEFKEYSNDNRNTGWELHRDGQRHLRLRDTNDERAADGAVGRKFTSPRHLCFSKRVSMAGLPLLLHSLQDHTCALIGANNPLQFGPVIKFFRGHAQVPHDVFAPIAQL
jgi:hypothetical protein